MSKKKKKQKTKKRNNTNKYPSASLLKEDCFNEYSRAISTYDKIYEKVNIMLAFCGIVLTILPTGIDFTHIKALSKPLPSNEYTISLVYSIVVIGSFLLLFSSTLKYLALLKGREITIIDVRTIRDDDIYTYKTEIAAVWLIEKYILSIEKTMKITAEKQKEFEDAITKTILAVILFAVSIVIKGVLL